MERSHSHSIVLQSMWGSEEEDAMPVKSLSARTKTRRVTFRLEAPAARTVVVSGSFCDWGTDCCPMKQRGDGTWTAAVSLAPGRYEYRFLVDGQWWDDPACAERTWNQFGSQNCVITVD